MSRISPMSQARARMGVAHPFWATLVFTTPAVMTTDVPTAATDMQTIFYNPEFIEPLSVDQLMFLIAHEAAHIMMLHGLRRQHRDARLFNEACDYAINLLLKEAGFALIDGCLIDARYAGMSAEQIYDVLAKQRKKEPKQGQGQGQGQGPPLGGIGQDVLDPASGQDPAAEAVLRRNVQQQVAQAASMARMAGKLSGNLARMVEGILEPQVPWPAVLREYMTRVTPDDEAWSRRNRRSPDVYLPSRHTERMGEIIIIGDTSGSITHTEIAQLVAEVVSIADNLRPERIRLVWADARVAGEQVFEAHEPVVAKPVGGGGTDMRVPLTHIEQYDPVVAVMFTDGCTPWPAIEPPYPLIVCCTTKLPCPVGEVVRV